MGDDFQETPVVYEVWSYKYKAQDETLTIYVPEEDDKVMKVKVTTHDFPHDDFFTFVFVLEGNPESKVTFTGINLERTTYF